MWEQVATFSAVLAMGFSHALCTGGSRATLALGEKGRLNREFRLTDKIGLASNSPRAYIQQLNLSREARTMGGFDARKTVGLPSEDSFTVSSPGARFGPPMGLKRTAGMSRWRRG
jgi:hypothetical protein